MPVGLRQNFPENTLEDFDKVVAALNFPSEWPDGLIAHGSHEVDGHLVVNDVWESRGHFDRFGEARLQATIGEALGERAREPEIVERELHTFFARETGRT